MTPPKISNNFQKDKSNLAWKIDHTQRIIQMLSIQICNERANSCQMTAVNCRLWRWIGNTPARSPTTGFSLPQNALPAMNRKMDDLNPRDLRRYIFPREDDGDIL